MKHWLLYYLISVLSAFNLPLSLMSEAPLTSTFFILYAIFCSSVYVSVQKKKSILKFIGFESLVFVSWMYIYYLYSLKMDQIQGGIEWILAGNLLSFLALSIPSRFISFLFLHFTINKLKARRAIMFKALFILTLAPSLYMVGEPLITGKIRQKKNFVNAKPTNYFLNNLLEAENEERQRCYDGLYEAADVMFVEPMLIVSEIERPLAEKSTKYKTISAISSIEGEHSQFERIDVNAYYEVADCFHIIKEKYYLLRTNSSEFAIREMDLDFSAKRMTTSFDILKESFDKRDLESFKKLLNSRKMKENPLTGVVVQNDELEFFKVIYEKEGQSALSTALSKAKIGSQIAQFALTQPLSVEQASRALKIKIQEGRAEEIDLLLKKGATFHYDDGSQRLMILGVVQNSDHFNRIIDLYLSNGGDISAKSIKGESLFLLAQSIDQVEYLLQKGAKLNDTDDEGRTLLLRLAQFGNNSSRFEMMKHLVEKGIDKKKKNDRGKTAYEVLRGDYCRDDTRKECPWIEVLK